MENKEGSIIANTIHQEKSLTFEVSHHFAPQVDNKIINTEIKCRTLDGMQKKNLQARKQLIVLSIFF